MLFFDTEEFDLEDQHLIRTDLLSGAAFSVGEGGGNEEFVFAADLHQLEGFGPAGNYAADGEGCGLSALNGAVEHGSVRQCSGIVHGNDALSGRLFAVALFQNFVLESGTGDDDVFIFLVLREEFRFLLLIFCDISVIDDL